MISKETSYAEFRYLGVAKTKKGQFYVSVSKTEIDLPHEILAVQRVDLADLRKGKRSLKEVSEDLRRSVEDNPIFLGKLKGNFGRIGYHSDGGRTHTAISVGEALGQVCLLFLTSHPKWNPFARLLSKEEAGMVGHPYRVNTYLAPVLRPEDEVYWSDLYLTDHRAEDLKNEFFMDVGRISCL